MNILVLLKQTFDTEEKIVIQGNAISEDGIKYIVNPYDEYAVEEAVKLKEELGGEVTVVSVGPDQAEEALRTALAMGADKAILVDDERLYADEFAAARALAAVAREGGYDLILGGQMTVDGGSGQTGPRLAEELGIPHVTAILKLTVDGSKAIVERDVEGSAEVLEVTLPAVLTAQQGLNEPRFPTLPNVMKAKKKPLVRMGMDDLGIAAEAASSKTQTVGYYLPAVKQAGRILQGDIASQARELASLLHNEAKVV